MRIQIQCVCVKLIWHNYLQFVLPITWSYGRKYGITLNQLASWWSEKPAKLAGQKNKVLKILRTLFNLMAIRPSQTPKNYIQLLFSCILQENLVDEKCISCASTESCRELFCQDTMLTQQYGNLKLSFNLMTAMLYIINIRFTSFLCLKCYTLILDK